MDKFLFILRENEIESTDYTSDVGYGGVPDLMEWLHMLDKSGNYCSGGPIATTGQYVTGHKMIEDKSSVDESGRILRYDVIMAENSNQAVSIAQTCPLVTHGLAVIEVRTILPLLR
jgi:hypothetical protein